MSGSRGPCGQATESCRHVPPACRYVALHFTPRAIQAYSAMLVAEVDGGADPRTRVFSCELRGEGSLPSLTLQVANSAGRQTDQRQAAACSGLPGVRQAKQSAGQQR